MYKYSIIIFISILFVLTSILIGCEGKTKAVVKKSIVVSKKINGNIEPLSKNKSEDSSILEVNKKTDQSGKVKKNDNSKIDHNLNSTQFNIVMVADQKNEPILSQIKPEEVFESVIKKTVKSESSQNENEEKRKAAELLSSIHQQANLTIDNTNDIDTLANPFLPLFSDAPPAPKDKKPKESDRKELTPLEKVDLSQLKLVATLRAASGNKALVEDSTGKGFVVNKGTFIGIHSGSVVEITSESIVVEEEIETLAGDIKIEKREIKLQKAPGE
jgi:type IV pilus assembly protein PilP